MRVNDLKFPALQVALDFTSLNKALDLLLKISDLGIGIVEVGTPLIKSEGLKAVSTIKSLVKDTPVLADTKTVDAGGVEAEMMLRAGANFVTVLAVADDPVIEAALDVTRGLGGDVVADFIGFRGDVLVRVSELQSLGVGAVNIHVGLDVQRARGLTASDMYELVKRISSEFSKLVVAVSGGIKPESIPRLLDAGAHVIVVGSAITRAQNPREVTKACLRAMGLPV